MRQTLVVLALVALVGCDSGRAAPMGDGLGGLGGSHAEGDGGWLGDDASLAGFGDAGRDAGTAPAVDAGHDAGVDTGVDAGPPCYPPEGLGESVPLECDACPASGCLPIIWDQSTAASGFQGVVSAKAIIKDNQNRSLIRTLYPSDETQAEWFNDGEFFESYRGQDIQVGIELELDAEPWVYSGMSAPMQGSSAIPSYLRLAARVSNQGAVVVWTMHRQPD